MLAITGVLYQSNAMELERCNKYVLSFSHIFLQYVVDAILKTQSSLVKDHFLTNSRSNQTFSPCRKFKVDQAPSAQTSILAIAYSIMAIDLIVGQFLQIPQRRIANEIDLVKSCSRINLLLTLHCTREYTFVFLSFYFFFFLIPDLVDE